MTHDIGNMVGYAFVVQHQARVTRWVVMDAPLPGIGDWDIIIRDPHLWHFNFRGPDVERLVAGRERIYLDRFYNELSANPKAIDEQTRNHYATLYARPHAMHDAFEQFAAFTQDAADNKAMLAQYGKLTMPVLAIGGGEILQYRHGSRHALRGQRCDGRRHRQFRPLADGRAAGGNDGRDPGLPALNVARKVPPDQSLIQRRFKA